MTTTAQGEGKRETWRDWLPPGHPEPPIVTRGALLGELARCGHALPARTLQRWEAAGALPAPIRRRRGGAARALSPVWYVEVVAALPRLRTARQPRAQLRARLRARFEQAAQQASRADAARGVRPLLPAGVVTALQRLVADLNARGAGVEAAELRLLRPGEEPLSDTLPAQASDQNEGRLIRAATRAKGARTPASPRWRTRRSALRPGCPPRLRRRPRASSPASSMSTPATPRPSPVSGARNAPVLAPRLGAVPGCMVFVPRDPRRFTAHRSPHPGIRSVGGCAAEGVAMWALRRAW